MNLSICIMIARSPEPTLVLVNYAMQTPMPTPRLGQGSTLSLPECCDGRRYSLPNKHEAVLEPPRAVSSFACDGLQPPGDLSLFSAPA